MAIFGKKYNYRSVVNLLLLEFPNDVFVVFNDLGINSNNMECTDLNAFEEDNIIEPCRACGIYYISDHTIIQPIFTKVGAGENPNRNMPEIVQLMNEWSLQVSEK